MPSVKSLPNNSLEVKKHLRTIFLTNAQHCSEVAATSKQCQTNLSLHNCNISHGGNRVDSELIVLSLTGSPLLLIHAKCKLASNPHKRRLNSSAGLHFMGLICLVTMRAEQTKVISVCSTIDCHASLLCDFTWLKPQGSKV